MFLFYLLIFPFDFSILSFDFSIFYFFTTTDLNQIKQITVETNSLPKGSHKIFEQINKYNSDLKKYKNILEKMNGDYYSEVTDREYDLTKKYIEGTNFLDESERRAQDVEDMGYTIMSELTSQRTTLLKTKRHVDETRQEQSRIKRIMLSIYNNKIIYKYLLIVIIILLAIANVGVIIYKIRR
ncbi:hypothetical protein, variant [Plasmodium yoelii 17X]|uniref:Vesicle transport v-SNARE N-terminal domain-containing protein n=1 Tax=Plasmodium yoelii 17X TaxID=1323249 RepID=V7PI34_PLAYE|nr:hypothetical protein, variant [Plasmodium yoelii 17X]